MLEVKPFSIIDVCNNLKVKRMPQILAEDQYNQIFGLPCLLIKYACS